MAKTILIVDDSASIRQVVGIALRGAGFDVLEAVDGVDGLKKCDGQKIHLIISDVNMPQLDGVNFVKALKQLPSYKFTPVIMLTTEGKESTMLEGKAAGVRAWVLKPFQPAALLDAVAKLIQP